MSGLNHEAAAAGETACRTTSRPLNTPHKNGAVARLAKLQQLAELKAAGVLSDEEFTAAKAKLVA